MSTGDARNVAVLISNYDSTVTPILTVVEAIQARASGTELITVGIEKQALSSIELLTLTSFPRDINQVYVPSFSLLQNYTGQVLDKLCPSEYLSYSSVCLILINFESVIDLSLKFVIGRCNLLIQFLCKCKF